MFSGLWRWTKRIILSAFLLIVLLLLPSAYIELFCGSEVKHAKYDPIITDETFQRTEANSYLTYPEWHIVYAYEGLARVLENRDEHEFDYLSSITGFWKSACSLNKTSQEHGEADFVTRGIIHIIGISFTVELGMKALYEETIGHLFAMIRGPIKSPQDEYAAWMARNFSNFLQQTPWYEYDFDTANEALWELPLKHSIRGWERRLALGGEWNAKSAYASMIADASNAAGPAILRIRLIVSDITPVDLQTLENVTVVRKIGENYEIEADRYRKLTLAMKAISERGGHIVEIAGNDDILVSAIRDRNTTIPELNTAEIISDLPRDGYSDNRILISSKVGKLSELFSELDTKDLKLEHVYDY